MPHVSELFGIPIRTLQGLYSRAKQRGFDPSHHPLEVLGQFIADAPRSGRPRKQPETKEDNVSTEVSYGRQGHGKTCANILSVLSLKSTLISVMTIEHLLEKLGLQKTKPNQKSWLMPKMRADRFCYGHMHHGIVLDSSQ